MVNSEIIVDEELSSDIVKRAMSGTISDQIADIVSTELSGMKYDAASFIVAMKAIDEELRIGTTIPWRSRSSLSQLSIKTVDRATRKIISDSMISLASYLSADQKFASEVSEILSKTKK